MRLVVLGLSLSSSWGNGHATTYRALLRAFAARGHAVTFLERDVPWYRAHRDLPDPDFCRLVLYDGPAVPDGPAGLAGPEGRSGLDAHADLIREADAVMVGSYVPDGVAVGRFVQSLAAGTTAFYDIDTPVTLAKLDRGDHEYVSPDLVAGYDLYLSFTGGPTLRRLEDRYGSPRARALYCSVDPDLYPVLDRPARWDLSYLGTYSADRQPTLERLLLGPARRRPDLRFAVAGPQYPEDVAWPDNVERFAHVGPADHAEFYAASRWTLNVTRADMIAAGWSPSVRLFEAASCAVPIVSDRWDGMDEVLRPGRDILVAEDGAAVLAALARPEADRRALGRAGRARVLAAHTAAHRAGELDAALSEVARDRRSRPGEVR